MFFSACLRKAAVGGAILLCFACKQKKIEARLGPPVVPVSIAKASLESVPFELRVVGTVEPSAAIQVKSQVGGELLRVHFKEGQNVEAKALLFQIDSRPYREALLQAQAAVARDRALLNQAEATLARDVAQSRNAEADAARNTELAKAGVISRAQQEQVRTSADVAREAARASEAAIGSARAAIESDLAAVDKAKLDISYCEIRAPISGRLGNLLVNAGNLVKPNDTPLVVLNRIAPIFVSFSAPEQHVGAIRRLGERGTLRVRAALQGNPERASTGRLSVIDNTVDPGTGTIRLKAVFDNRDGLLWPGQFVNVVLALGATVDATVVPAEAVQAGQQGQFVYVVKADGTAEPRVVVAGRAFERKVVIEKGISPGDTVVTDGQLRLFPGARIKAVDARKIESENI